MVLDTMRDATALGRGVNLYTFLVTPSQKINSGATFFYTPSSRRALPAYGGVNVFSLFLLYEVDHAGGFKAVSYGTFSSTALNQSVEIANMPVFSKTSVRIGLYDLRPRAQNETMDAVSINTVNAGDATWLFDTFFDTAVPDALSPKRRHTSGTKRKSFYIIAPRKKR